MKTLKEAIDIMKENGIFSKDFQIPLTYSEQFPDIMRKPIVDHSEPTCFHEVWKIANECMQTAREYFPQNNMYIQAQRNFDADDDFDVTWWIYIELEDRDMTRPYMDMLHILDGWMSVAYEFSMPFVFDFTHGRVTKGKLE